MRLLLLSWAVKKVQVKHVAAPQFAVGVPWWTIRTVYRVAVD